MRFSSKPLTLRVLLLICLTFAGGSVRAQESEAPIQYPTLTALQETVVPASDPVALTRRLRGIKNIPPPPVSPPVRQIGEKQLFWVSNDSENSEFQVSATLRVIGEHIYMWLEDGAPVSDTDLQALADAFDNTIYDSVRNLWGSEATPGVDGDPRIYGLFAHNLGSGLAAYFVGRHTFPVEVYPTSNQHEMFFFNLDGIGTFNIANPYVESVVVHEFQHMIRANIQDNDALWLNEGLSTFTQLLLYNDLGSALNFLSAPQTQLNTWAEEEPRAPHYGAAMLFIDYYYERYGLDAVHQLSADPGISLDAFDHVLKSMDEPGVDELFADWSVANVVLDPSLGDGQYGYHNLPADLPTPTPIAIIESYPYKIDGQSNQYANDYFVLTNLGNQQKLSISFTSPESVQLIPTDAASGQWIWYSNRGDVSDMTLTRAFDLSAVTEATLAYKAWYDIEEGWDYGYVMVSADDGESWDILPTSHTTDSNPHGNAYGPGYSGESSGWINESISLDEYAGKTILVRFEMITDDGISQPGLAIDDVSIREIGYKSNFEADDGGWEGEGWIRIDNRLPQQTWIQVIEQVGSDIEVTRWLAAGEGTWSLSLAEGTDQVTLSVSPFAPTTTEAMPYTLEIDIQ
jgi:immune inhibitor A